MNPRDMDAFYDAIKAYDWVRNGEANPDSPGGLKLTLLPANRQAETSLVQFWVGGS